MCGRFGLAASTKDIAERFQVQETLFEVLPRYNIAPSERIAVVTADGPRRLEGFRWGLVPSWAKDPEIGNRMINARAETVAEKPSFKNALVRRRCLIPVSGFYEWKRAGKSKQPMYIQAASHDLLALAGLWEEWRQPDGTALRTCAIITTTPNELMADIHDRMPVILSPAEEGAWLDAEWHNVPGLLGLLRPYPAQELTAHPVAPLVNTPGCDAPECVASIVDEVKPGEVK